jgi:hypothetical protein
MESVARTFFLKMNSYKDFWEGQKPSLFGGYRSNGALSTCQRLVKSYAERFAENSPPAPAQVSPPSEEAAENSIALNIPPQSMKRIPQEFSEATQSKETKRLCE